MTKYAFDRKAFATSLHMEKWGRGGTTRSFAEWFGVSASTISRWENAKAEPPIVEFLLICSCLGLDPLSYIMIESGEQPALPGFEDHVDPALVPLATQLYWDGFDEVGVNDLEAIQKDEEFIGLDDASGGYR